MVVINSDLSEILYSTYLGGDDMDRVDFVQVNGSDEIIGLGFTRSSDLPVTTNAIDTEVNNNDMMLFKVDYKLTGNSSLQYLSYFGGSLLDEAAGLTVDSNGNIYISARTTSRDMITMGSLQNDHSDSNQNF